MADSVLFERLLQQVFEHGININTLSTLEDGTCEDIRLLLKPWPKPKKQKTTEKVENLSAVTEAPKAPEVLLAEKALAKAEKTRNRFKDKSPLLQHSHGTFSNKSTLNNPQVNLTEATQVETQQNTDQNDINEEQIHLQTEDEVLPVEATSTQVDNSLNPQPGIAVIPQSKLNAILDSKASSYQNHGAKGGKTKATVPVSSSSSSSRGLSSKSKQQSTKSQANAKYTPVFKSAPFQTVAPVKKQKPGLTRAQMLRANANASKVQSAPMSKVESTSSSRRGLSSQRIGQGLNQPRVNSATHSARTKAPDLNTKKNGSRIVLDTKDGDRNKSHVGRTKAASQPLDNSTHSTRTNMVEVRHGQVRSDSLDLKSLETRLGMMNLGKHGRHDNVNNNGNNNPCDDCSEDKGVDEDLPFVLSQDGKKLKMPPKYVRLVSSNRKMRQKLKFEGMTKKAQETVSARDHFLHRIDQYFSQNLSEVEFQQLLERKKLCDEYQCLHEIFKHICQTPLSEKSSFQQVLRCKRHIEHVFVTFTELEDQFFRLCRKQAFKGTSPVQYKELTERLQRKKSTSPQFWLSTHIMPDTLSVPAAICYESVRQLTEYTDLLQQIQSLKWEQFVMDQVSKEILPYLQKCDCDNDSMAVKLYRCAYSLLCTRGTTFPTVVHDSEESDESSLTDQFSDENV